MSQFETENVIREFAGVMPIRKIMGLTGKELAVLAGTSHPNISRIENLKTDPAFTLCYRIATVLGLRLADMLNLFYPVAQADGLYLFRLPYNINHPELEAMVEELNEEKTLEGFYLPGSNTRDRAEILLSFTKKAGEIEATTTEYREQGRAEHVPLPPEKRLEAEGVPNEIKIGEALEKIRSIKGLTLRTLAEKSRLSYSFISGLENNEFDCGIKGFDLLARALGLTTDELIYIAHPPARRWPLFLRRAYYRNREMVALVQNLNFRFDKLSLQDRAEAMVSFKNWLAQEQSVRMTRSQETVPVPAVYTRLRLGLPSAYSG